jgi:hypothetical protein
LCKYHFENKRNTNHQDQSNDECFHWMPLLIKTTTKYLKPLSKLRQSMKYQRAN